MRSPLPPPAPILLIIALAAGAVLSAVGAGTAFAQTSPQPGAAQTRAATEPELQGRGLVEALRRGGYVLYLRHTSTDFSKNDAAMTSYADCASQRNLTDRGRDEARAIARALRELRIPISDVLASPYCRTMETGRLAFGKASPSVAVRGGPAQPDSADRYAALRRLLSTPVMGHTNLAIASHGNPFRAVAPPPYLSEGEMAVIRPLGHGEFRIVARIPLTEWSALVAYAR